MRELYFTHASSSSGPYKTAFHVAEQFRPYKLISDSAHVNTTKVNLTDSVSMAFPCDDAGAEIDPAGDRSAGSDDVNDRRLEPRFVDFSGHGQISSVLAPLALLLHLRLHPTDPAR
jgi:hypothetical protein